MSIVQTKRLVSGTREWAVQNVNCVLGCPHKCRYCYARANAVRFGRIEDPEEWGESYHRVRPKEVQRRRKLVDGQVMFPTTHDITPEFLEPCLETIHNILKPGNRLLIVSKPHLECIKAICERFPGYRDKILFRFSIGADSDEILSYWEPGAPNFNERLDSLAHACLSRFKTSVSAEPLLDVPHVKRLVGQLRPYVTDSIWIGKMNQVRKRCVPGTSPGAIDSIERCQTDQWVRLVARVLQGDPLVRWKDSYKRVLGLKLADKPGLDA